MHICKLKEASLYSHLQALEKSLSYVRQTKKPATFLNLIFIEETSLIRQAKRGRYPIVAKVLGKAFINLDEEDLFLAAQEKIVDELIEDTPLLSPFRRIYRNFYPQKAPR